MAAGTEKPEQGQKSDGVLMRVSYSFSVCERRDWFLHYFVTRCQET